MNTKLQKMNSEKPRDELDIFLFEYELLRDEILDHFSISNNIAAVFATAIFALIGIAFSGWDLKIFALFPLLFLVFLSFEIHMEACISYLHTNLIILEEEINNHFNCDPLIWESKLVMRNLNKYRLKKGK